MGTAGLIITSSFCLPIKAKVFFSCLGAPAPLHISDVAIATVDSDGQLRVSRMLSDVLKDIYYLPRGRASAAFHTLNRFLEKMRRVATTVM